MMKKNLRWRGPRPRARWRLSYTRAYALACDFFLVADGHQEDLEAMEADYYASGYL